MVQDDKAVGLDGVRVEFDDERAVSDAGIALVAALAGRLGLEALAAERVTLRDRAAGAANAGRKVIAILYAMVLAADSIDDCDVLRAGRTGRLRWMHPGPLDVGNVPAGVHVRARPSARYALLGQAIERAWKAGAGPGAGRLVIDVDSFVGPKRPTRAGG